MQGGEAVRAMETGLQFSHKLSPGRFHITAKIIVMPCLAASITRSLSSHHAFILGKGKNEQFTIDINLYSVGFV